MEGLLHKGQLLVNEDFMVYVQFVYLSVHELLEKEKSQDRSSYSMDVYCQCYLLFVHLYGYHHIELILVSLL